MDSFNKKKSGCGFLQVNRMKISLATGGGGTGINLGTGVYKRLV